MTKALVAILKLLKNKDIRKAIGFIFLIPVALILFIIMIVTLLISSLIGILNDDESTSHYNAIVNVSNSLDIQNNLSSYLLRSVDMLDDGDLIEDENSIEQYIKSYFIKEVRVYNEDEDGNEIVTVYYEFKTADEIYNMVKTPPFNLTNDDIELIKLADINSSSTIKLLKPVNNKISSPYGPRIHPVTGKQSFHTGIDIPASYGTSILASDSGVVKFSGYSRVYGNYIIIEHANGISTMYAHNSKNTVQLFQEVSRGEKIAEVGSTGTSTGNHVHFEVRINGKHTNPINYLE